MLTAVRDLLRQCVEAGDDFEVAHAREDDALRAVVLMCAQGPTVVRVSVAPLLPCTVCLRWGHSEDCRVCLGEGVAPAPVDVPAPDPLPDWTEEAVELELLRVLSLCRVRGPEHTARSIVRGLASLLGHTSPLAAIQARTGASRSVADSVVSAIAGSLRGRARGLRAGRYGRDAERGEMAARRLDALAERIERSALAEQRRAG